MNGAHYLIYLWILPVTLQILLPLAILLGWSAAKLPALLAAGPTEQRHAEAVPAR